MNRKIARNKLKRIIAAPLCGKGLTTRRGVESKRREATTDVEDQHGNDRPIRRETEKSTILQHRFEVEEGSWRMIYRYNFEGEGDRPPRGI